MVRKSALQEPKQLRANEEFDRLGTKRQNYRKVEVQKNNIHCLLCLFLPAQPVVHRSQSLPRLVCLPYLSIPLFGLLIFPWPAKSNFHVVLIL